MRLRYLISLVNDKSLNTLLLYSEYELKTAARNML